MTHFGGFGVPAGTTDAPSPFSGRVDGFQAFAALAVGGNKPEQLPSATTSAPQEKPLSPSKPMSKYEKGQVIQYRDSHGNICPGEIIEVHFDAELKPFYTIKLPCGKEKQTDDAHLSIPEISPIQREIEKMIPIAASEISSKAFASSRSSTMTDFGGFGVPAGTTDASFSGRVDVKFTIGKSPATKRRKSRTDFRRVFPCRRVVDFKKKAIDRTYQLLDRQRASRTAAVNARRGILTPNKPSAMEVKVKPSAMEVEPEVVFQATTAPATTSTAHVNMSFGKFDAYLAKRFFITLRRL